MSSSLRIIFDPENPAGKLCSVEDLPSLISEGLIEEETQVWNESDGCWESAAVSRFTKHLFVQSVEVKNVAS